MLNESQSRHFHRQGYLVLERQFPRAVMENLRQAAEQIIDRFDIDAHRTVFKTTDRDAGRDDYFFESAERVHCFLEERALNAAGELVVEKHRAINKIGHALHDHVAEFQAFCTDPFFARALDMLGYTRPLLWQTMYICKPPRIGGEVRWHQDASYLVSDPPSVVGMWLAIEDADRNNGCLWMAPGAHRGPLRELYEVDWESRRGHLRTLDETPWPDAADAVPIEAPQGSLVLFSDHMPHYSSVNTSERSRHAFTLHFADARSTWSAGNWLQRPRLGPFPV